MASEDQPFGDDSGAGPRPRRGARGRHPARRYDKFIDALHESLWFRPSLWMLGFAGLALGLVALDIWFDARFEPGRVPRLLRSSPDDARTLLGAIVGAMLTVVSLAFSVVMLAVVQMANAYSPRLLRLYISDVRNQHVLGVLLGTFLYALIVLRSVRAAGFAPTFAINAGVVLAVLATVALISFLHHVPQSIKVAAIIRMILAGAEAELDRAFPAGIGVRSPSPDPARLAEPARRVRARQSGYVQIFDLEPLAERTRERPLLLRLPWRMGDFVLEGTTLALAWGPFDERDRRALDRAIVFGTERTMRQDPRFGVEQLTDVALRALSPGVNDPTTTCAAINALTVLFGRLLAREQPALWRSDTRGRIHVEFEVASFAELIQLSYLRILAYGARDIQIVRRLVGATGQLHAVAQTDAQRAELVALLETTHAEADRSVELTVVRRTLDDDFGRACEAVGRPALPRLAQRSSSHAAASALDPKILHG